MSADGVAELCERFANRALLLESRREEAADGAGLALHAARSIEETHDVFVAKHAVLPAGEAPHQVVSVVRDARRRRPEALSEILDLGANGLHVPKGDERAHEPHELLVEGTTKPVHKADGIGRETPLHIARREDLLEDGADAAEARGLLPFSACRSHR